VERIAAIGTSGGGPPALAFAARYPERTAALILQCAQSHRWDDARWAPQSYSWIYRCYRNSLSRWFFCRFYIMLFRLGIRTADRYLRDLTGSRYTTMGDDVQARQLAETFHSNIGEVRWMRDGLANDAATWLHEDVLSNASVTCPTQVLHDSKDPRAPFCHAEYAAAKIPGAELVDLDAGGHLIWYGRDARLMQERRTAFLLKHLAASPN
jgi:pimeloyl-ACP methyl ester carboxylesterase